MPAVLGDFLAAANEHLEAAVVVGDGQLPQLPEVVRDLHRLVAVMWHHLDDLAPCDEVGASNWDGLHVWERAVIDAGVAMRAAVACLGRGAAGSGDPASSAASWRARHLAAAAASLAAGRDLLHTHHAPDPDGLIRGRSEWAPVITSLSVTRALAGQVTRWSWQLAPFTAWLAGSTMSYALPRTPDQAVSAAICDSLVSASQWLQVAAAAVRPAIEADPVQTADIELLGAVPAAGVPQRLRPGPAGESVAELCDGITVSATRLRAAMRGSAERARWSPAVTSGGWQWMAQAAAVTSHLAELALRALAARAGQLTGLPVTAAQLDSAADGLAGMRAAWQRVDRMWDAIITESRLLQSPAMTEASDLVLRMGRLVWDNPRWTPARCDRAPRRSPAALAAGPAAITAVVAAVHHAADAVARIAVTDIEAVKAAGQAGRLYVPTRSLHEDDNVPRMFAMAPSSRCRRLEDTYQAALEASLEAARALDVLAVATRAPSMPLTLARGAVSVQSHRRIRLVDGDHDDVLATDLMPFANSRASTSQAGLLEQALIDRRVSDPVILLRASAIDDAARRLMLHAESKAAEPETPGTRQSRRLPAPGAAGLAARAFPHSPAAGLSGDSHHVRPGNPALPAPAPRAELRSRNSARHRRLSSEQGWHPRSVEPVRAGFRNRGLTTETARRSAHRIGG